MTLKGIALAAALLAAMTTDAAACHRFSVWRYPWPQRCDNGQRSKSVLADRRIHLRSPYVFSRHLPMGGTSPPVEAVDSNVGLALPLPSLARADLDGGEADEAARARLLLRAALEAANAH